MRKGIGQIRQILYTTKHCEFTRHWIHFRCRIQNLSRLDQIGNFSIRIPVLHLLKSRKFFFFRWGGRGGGEKAIWRIGLPLKKYPGYLPDFYHIFCNTNKTLISNAKNNSSPICLLIVGTFEKQLPVLGTVSAFWH